MNCPFCGAPLLPQENPCPYCGCDSAGQNTAAAAEPAKSGHPRLPAVILAVLFCIGLLFYFLIPLDSEPSQQERAGSASFSKDDLPSLPAAVNNDPAVSGWFLLENGVLYFDAEAYSGGKVLTVPEAINGMAVEAIGNECFRGCDRLTTILLPSTITSIGDYAFADCDALRGVLIPERVERIGSCAFLGCDALRAVYIPTSVESVGNDAFSECPALLYVFYSGFYDEWIQMYPDVITPFTWAVCWDGDYRHGALFQ